MTELTDRMRTVVAYLRTTQLIRDYDAIKDAVDLLDEAAVLLDDAIKKPAEPEMLGEAMEILKPYPFTVSAPPVDDAWIAPGGPLPGMKATGTRSPRACPRCDSRAYKRVFRKERKMYLHCGGCGHEWLFSEAARA